MWHTDYYSKLLEVHWFFSSFFHSKVNPNGSVIAVGFEDGVVRIIEVYDPKELPQLPNSHSPTPEPPCSVTVRRPTCCCSASLVQENIDSGEQWLQEPASWIPERISWRAENMQVLLVPLLAFPFFFSTWMEDALIKLFRQCLKPTKYLKIQIISH